MSIFLKKQQQPDIHCRDTAFVLGDCFSFRPQTKGLPEEILALHPARCYTNPHIRSLNLAMSAGIVLYESLRQ